MKVTFTCLLLACTTIVFSQQKGDKKIIIKLADTVGVYDKVKIALVKADFIVKDLNFSDSITTFPRELKTMSGTAIANATIKENRIILNGFYTLKKLNYFGHTKISKDFKPIIYYKGGKLWPLLMKVATDIGGEIEYSE